MPLGTLTILRGLDARHVMETISSRPREESFRAALPWTHPNDQAVFHPLEPRPTIRLLDVRQLIEAGPVIAWKGSRSRSSETLIGLSFEQPQPDEYVNAEHDNESPDHDAPLPGCQSDIHQWRCMIQCQCQRPDR